MGNAGDKILYSSSSLSDAARRLQQVGAALQQERSGLLSTLSELDNGNGGDCRIQGRIHLTTVGASYSAGTIDGFIRDLAQALTAEGSYAKDLAGRLNKISEMFAATERELTGQINSLFEGENPFSGEGGGTIEQSDDATVLGNSFDLGDLAKKVIGCFGPIGSFVGAGITVYEAIKGGDWVKAGKSVAESMVSWSQFAKTYKWSNFNKANSFGHNWGTKSYAKRLLGLTRETGSKAAAWGNRVAANFENGLKGTFVKFDPKAAGSGYKPNWFGIVGTVVDFGFNAYENQQQVAAGEISQDRAVVETVAETAANLALATAAGAIAAATLPVSAPAVAVAAAGAGIVWAADGVTKWITGGDKGLGELASEGVGVIWDNTLGKLFD